MNHLLAAGRQALQELENELDNVPLSHTQHDYLFERIHRVETALTEPKAVHQPWRDLKTKLKQMLKTIDVTMVDMPRDRNGVKSALAATEYKTIKRTQLEYILTLMDELEE